MSAIPAAEVDASVLGAAAGDVFLRIDRAGYADRLRGFWLGANIGNWTGLPTENVRAEPPFFTDADWLTAVGRDGETIDFVLNSDPWGADDDTDIEYVYQSAMIRHRTHRLGAAQIAAAWRRHIDLPLVWVSNLAALGQMQHGALPPATSLPENNPMWDMIDAQLTTELFGALAPGRPDVALDMAQLPIRTTAHLHSAWAAEFYVIMHALVAAADPAQAPHQQLLRMAEEARSRVPDWSYIADMYYFVKSDYAGNPDKQDWEATRDRLYARYQRDGAAGYQYKYPWDAGINFGASLVSLFYGQGDFRNTIRIATLAGWDADNPAATWGGLLGLMMGRRGLAKYFASSQFSDRYLISRTRFNYPQAPDTFTRMAADGLSIVDMVATSHGGQIAADHWLIPRAAPPVRAPDSTETVVPWTTIEDNDPRWRYDGFHTRERVWNASGATLTSGTAGCAAQITITASALQYYAWRSHSSGNVRITLNDEAPITVSLFTDASPKGQYYAKVYERRNLPPQSHTLRIECDDAATDKSIDMLSIIAPSGEAAVRVR